MVSVPRDPASAPSPPVPPSLPAPAGWRSSGESLNGHAGTARAGGRGRRGRRPGQLRPVATPPHTGLVPAPIPASRRCRCSTKAEATPRHEPWLGRGRAGRRAPAGPVERHASRRRRAGPLRAGRAAVSRVWAGGASAAHAVGGVSGGRRRGLGGGRGPRTRRRGSGRGRCAGWRCRSGPTRSGGGPGRGRCGCHGPHRCGYGPWRGRPGGSDRRWSYSNSGDLHPGWCGRAWPVAGAGSAATEARAPAARAAAARRRAVAEAEPDKKSPSGVTPWWGLPSRVGGRARGVAVRQGETTAPWSRRWRSRSNEHVDGEEGAAFFGGEASGAEQRGGPGAPPKSCGARMPSPPAMTRPSRTATRRSACGRRRVMSPTGWP